MAATAAYAAELSSLIEELQFTWPDTAAALSPVGSSPIAQLHRALSSLPPRASTSTRVSLPPAPLLLPSLLALAHDRISSFPYSSVPPAYLRLYSETALVWALHDLAQPLPPSPTPGDGAEDEGFWRGVVARLDMVLIVSGAPGEGRADFVERTIDLVQAMHLPSTPWVPPTSSSPPPSKRARTDPSSSGDSRLFLAPSSIPSLARPPSLSSFLSTHRHAPFVLPRHLHREGWPAVSPTSPWRSRAYILSVVGGGRVVPVELGGEYTSEGWGQAIVPFEEFLDRIGWGEHGPRAGEERQGEEGQLPMYLAQHSLLTQFPKLRRDVLLPDYVHSSPPEDPEDQEGGYRAPTTADGVLINVWVGAAGRSSPAHTDPYHNCYTQVVGRKRIFLVPPHHARAMYAFSSSPSSSPPPSPSSSSPEAEEDSTNCLMTNTSRVPIFTSSSPSSTSTPPPTSSPSPPFRPSLQAYPRFHAEALPDALEAVLEEGDLVFIPPGWWHALRQEGPGPGWGVSFWF